jgi:hypothetical protein
MPASRGGGAWPESAEAAETLARVSGGARADREKERRGQPVAGTEGRRERKAHAYAEEL